LGPSLGIPITSLAPPTNFHSRNLPPSLSPISIISQIPIRPSLSQTFAFKIYSNTLLRPKSAFTVFETSLGVSAPRNLPSLQAAADMFGKRIENLLIGLFFVDFWFFGEL
jgi:hypothetical protein